MLPKLGLYSQRFFVNRKLKQHSRVSIKMGKTRQKRAPPPPDKSPLLEVERPARRERNYSSISSFSSIEDSLMDLTKQMELLESPSRPTTLASGEDQGPPSPYLAPCWKPQSRFSIIRARAYAKNSEESKFIPYHELAFKTAKPAAGSSTERNSADEKLKRQKQKPFTRKTEKEKHKTSEGGAARTSVLKTYAREKRIFKGAPKRVTWEDAPSTPVKKAKLCELAPFSKSEPSPIQESKTGNEDPNWLLFSSPLPAEKDEKLKSSSKRGRQKTAPKKKLPLKRHVSEGVPEDGAKRVRKLPLLKDVDLSSSTSSSPIPVSRPRFFRLRTKPPLRSALGRRAKERNSAARAMAQAGGNENSDEGFQE